MLVEVVVQFRVEKAVVGEPHEVEVVEDETIAQSRRQPSIYHFIF